MSATPLSDALQTVARELAQQLKLANCQLVLAESCTGGRVAAELTRVPGISQFFCGSAVVYQEATKTAWLGVPQALFQPDGPGGVSGETAEAMAAGVLAHTPAADLAVAITGHLGPDAPPDLDGVTFHGWATRASSGHARHQLPSFPDGAEPPLTLRDIRQRVAAWQLLRTAIAVIAESHGTADSRGV